MNRTTSLVERERNKSTRKKIRHPAGISTQDLLNTTQTFKPLGLLAEERLCKILANRSLLCCPFTEELHQDKDVDSSMGSSLSTDTKSATFSEVSYYLV